MCLCIPTIWPSKNFVHSSALNCHVRIGFPKEKQSCSFTHLWGGTNGTCASNLVIRTASEMGNAWEPTSPTALRSIISKKLGRWDKPIPISPTEAVLPHRLPHKIYIYHYIQHPRSILPTSAMSFHCSFYSFEIPIHKNNTFCLFLAVLLFVHALGQGQPHTGTASPPPPWWGLHKLLKYK